MKKSPIQKKYVKYCNFNRNNIFWLTHTMDFSEAKAELAIRDNFVSKIRSTFESRDAYHFHNYIFNNSNLSEYFVSIVKNSPPIVDKKRYTLTIKYRIPSQYDRYAQTLNFPHETIEQCLHQIYLLCNTDLYCTCCDGKISEITPEMRDLRMLFRI